MNRLLPPWRRPPRLFIWLLAAACVGLALGAEQLRLRRNAALADIAAPLPQGFEPLLPSSSLAALRGRGFEDQAEADLIRIYQLVAKGKLAQATRDSATLAARYPNFTLAQVLRGDLLLANAGRLDHFIDVPPGAGKPGQAAALAQEARQRLRAYTDAPAFGDIPSNFVELGPGVRHAILVDTSRSRLYLFGRAPNGALRVEANYYVTQGKLGAEKQRAGDLRTPLGVYFITREVGKRWLAQIYGAGAMPLNYPNAWDRLLGRTGGGIWLHGVPPDSYARPPLDSDGCVVLANPDIEALMRHVDGGTTPVVITRSAEWLDAPQIAARRAALRQMLARNGAATGKSQEDTTMLYFNGQHELLVVQYPGDGRQHPVTHRDYWSKQNGQWHLFHTGVLS